MSYRQEFVGGYFLLARPVETVTKMIPETGRRSLVGDAETDGMRRQGGCCCAERLLLLLLLL